MQKKIRFFYVSPHVLFYYYLAKTWRKFNKADMGEIWLSWHGRNLTKLTWGKFDKAIMGEIWPSWHGENLTKLSWAKFDKIGMGEILPNWHGGNLTSRNEKLAMGEIWPSWLGGKVQPILIRKMPLTVLVPAILKLRSSYHRHNTFLIVDTSSYEMEI